MWFNSSSAAEGAKLLGPATAIQRWKRPGSN
nr:MAG TPA: hypothetical protein [Caudoviricetes sp.]